MARLILIFILVVSSSFASAQEAKQDNNVINKYGPRRQISTIVYMGLAGAVLGLSTLSFYGRPQDKLTNIPIGFGVGVIIGTVYMTYQAATNPDEFYRESEYKPEFQKKESVDLIAADLFMAKPRPDISYRWTF